MDNIFIERLWRSMKYEAVYLHELSDGFAAQRAIAKWLNFYNTTRPHSALAGAIPAEAYEKGLPPQLPPKPHRLPASLPAQPVHKVMITGTTSARLHFQSIRPPLFIVTVREISSFCFPD